MCFYFPLIARVCSYSRKLLIWSCCYWNVIFLAFILTVFQEENLNLYFVVVNLLSPKPRLLRVLYSLTCILICGDVHGLLLIFFCYQLNCNYLFNWISVILQWILLFEPTTAEWSMHDCWSLLCLYYAVCGQLLSLFTILLVKLI